MHREMSFRWIGLSVLAPLALMLVVGCQQAEGERCQINADCEDGLVCNASEQICQQPGAGAPDANTTDSSPPIDALDAMPAIDGGVDAMADAMVNDALVNDALVNDAAP